VASVSRCGPWQPCRLDRANYDLTGITVSCPPRPSSPHSVKLDPKEKKAASVSTGQYRTVLYGSDWNMVCQIDIQSSSLSTTRRSV
jgi:hypothetical protein